MQMFSLARERARHLRDAVVGSDPGLSRLRMATGAAVAMATALAVELVVARLRDADAMGTLVGMLLGAVVAMMGSMALGSGTAWVKVRTAAGFPVAIGLGMLGGVVTGGHTRAMLAAFVAVMFVAVFVRRFGIPFFFYGFMLWMGYFFGSFLHATWVMVPWLLAEVAIASAWVLLLSLTVLRTNPQRTLGRVRRSFDARAHRMADALTALLSGEEDRSARSHARQLRRLHSLQAQVGEAALMIEAWSGEQGALPPEWAPQALRRRVLDVQLALDGIAAGGEELRNATAQIREAASATTRALSLGRTATAAHRADELERLAQRLPEGRHRRAAALLADSVREYAVLVREAGNPPEVEPTDFTPSVSLAMGYLPGSVSVARDVEALGRHWNPLSRLDFTTRQAVQVAVAGALAIVLGRWLDQTRYYWAVIAAFIAFTGTGSRMETFFKASNRVLGTLVGLVAGIELAHVTTGHPAWILTTIVLSMFCGFYLVRINYACMIFFVTIMVAQLYTVLHEFSDQLLVLRLEETVLGAAAGILVGLLVTPLSTRDTVRLAQRDLLTSLAALLDRVAGRQPEDPEAESDPEALMRDVENQMRELALVAAPLNRSLLVADDRRLVRHRLLLHGRTVQTARALVAGTRGEVAVEVVADLDALAGRLRALAEDPPALGAPLPRRTEASPVTSPAGPAGASATARTVARLYRLVLELAGPPRHDARRAGDASPAPLGSEA